MKHKKKQSWHHTLSKAHSELARERHSHKHNSREAEDIIGTQLESSGKKRFTEQDLGNSCSNRVEHETNSTSFSTANPWATLDHPHTMRQGGESLEEHDNARGFGATHREENGNLEFRDVDSIKTNHAFAEKSFQHKHAKSINNSDHPHNTRQGEG